MKLTRCLVLMLALAPPLACASVRIDPLDPYQPYECATVYWNDKDAVFAYAVQDDGAYVRVDGTLHLLRKIGLEREVFPEGSAVGRHLTETWVGDKLTLTLDVRVTEDADPFYTLSGKIWVRGGDSYAELPVVAYVGCAFSG